MQRHRVRLAQEFVEQAEARAERVLGVFGEPRRVVIDDRHAERPGETGDLAADIAEPDDARRLAAQFAQAGDLVAAPAPGGDVRVLEDQPARHGQHQQQGVFGDGDRIGAAIVGDRDSRAPRRGDVRAVVAGAQQLDQAQPGRLPEQRFVDGAVDETDEIFGVGDRDIEFRTPDRRLGQVETRRSEVPRRLRGAGEPGGENDLRAHGLLLPGHRPAVSAPADILPIR